MKDSFTRRLLEITVTIAIIILLYIIFSSSNFGCSNTSSVQQINEPNDNVPSEPNYKSPENVEEISRWPYPLNKILRAKNV